MLKNFELYARIAFVIIFIFGVDLIINFLFGGFFFSFIYTIWNFILIGIPSLFIGLIIFILIQRTSFKKYMTKKNVNIFCVILGIVFSSLLIINFTTNITINSTVFIRHHWNCDESQDICKIIDGINLYKDAEYGRYKGNFFNNSYGFWQFTWDYDSSTKVLTLHDEYEMWTIVLNINITSNNIPLHMTTTYMNSSGNPPFDVELFNNVSWTAE